VPVNVEQNEIHVAEKIIAARWFALPQLAGDAFIEAVGIVI
jgi:hypothetical protein